MENPTPQQLNSSKRGSIKQQLEKQHRENVLGAARKRMGELYEDNQVIGRRMAIGCVSLEVTQRCNLDCTLCYLSEYAESVKDIPMEEIYRRIDEIKMHFGSGTDVQISGGDPTLRDTDELVAIVKRIKERGMRPTLMTNGIKADRRMLTRLADAGLYDVAFHVDITQERKGYTTESSLNEIRRRYIDQVRGLPITCIFNTTVCQENFHEIPELIQFYRQNADVVAMASFQLQADTGRGTLRKRAQVISLQTVRDQISKGADVNIAWETILIGHPQCHRAGLCVVVNGNVYDINDNPKIYNRFLQDFRNVMLDRRDSNRVLWDLLSEALKKPYWFLIGLKYMATHIWRMKKDLILSGFKIHKQSYFVQNFMDADHLDEERVHACSFMVMTSEGPISMCAHNAKRDEYLLKPIAVTQGSWDPLSGKIQPSIKRMEESNETDHQMAGIQQPARSTVELRQ